jgi:hypothetical protein
MSDLRRAAARMLPYALAALPFLYLVRLTSTLYVDVPFWDEWELVRKLDMLDRGTLTFADLRAQHNEHRPMFPIITLIALARLSSWNIGWEIAANVLFGLLIFLFLVLRVRGSPPAVTPIWLPPLLAVLVFSPAQFENWLWGWQLTMMMGTAAAVGGLRLLSTAPPTRVRFAGAIGCGVVTTYCFASGLVYWAAGPVCLLLHAERRWRGRLVVWTIAAGATVASYLYGYVPPPPPAGVDVAPFLHRVPWIVLYIVKYVGAPVSGWNHQLAGAIGTALLIAFGILLIRLWPRRADPEVIFAVAIGAYTLGAAAITAFGRTNADGSGALVSRYMTTGTLMWASVLLLWANAGIRVKAVAWATVAVSLAIAAASAATAIPALRFARARHDLQVVARRNLIAGGQSDTLMRVLHPDPQTVRQRRAILQMLGVSVFRDHQQ